LSSCAERVIACPLRDQSAHSRGWQLWHAFDDQVSRDIAGFSGGAKAVAAVELAVVGEAGTAVVTGVELVVIAAAA
jgi:hypothetical protein